MVLCPICMKDFSKSWIDSHVNLCLTKKEQDDSVVDEKRSKNDDIITSSKNDDEVDVNTKANEYVHTPKKVKSTDRNEIAPHSHNGAMNITAESMQLMKSELNMDTLSSSASSSNEVIINSTKPLATKQDALNFLLQLRSFSNTHSIEELSLNDLISNATYTDSKKKDNMKHNKLLYKFLSIVQQIKKGHLSGGV